MDLVAGVVGKLPSKLLELLKDEYKLQRGLKEKIKASARELERMHATLRKVADVPLEQLDELVRLWARDIREASYDMEDVLGTFLVRVDGGSPHPTDKDKVKRMLKKLGNVFSLSKSKTRREIGSSIQVLSEQLEDMAALRDRYKIDSIVAKPAAETSIDPLLDALFVNASQLVGIDEPRDQLIKMLSLGDDDNNKGTKIVSVVGIGGLGKTTLAKAVYDRFDKADFDDHGRAFVSVGRNPDLKSVLRDILIALDMQRYTKEFNLGALGEQRLIGEIRDFLKNKRYFIVIDDIWDVPSWKKIRYALDDNKLGSKIIITTRNMDVAQKVGCFSYGMKPLPLASSKVLFYGRIFGSENKCPRELSKVSENILKKCGGVPLAIVTVSSLLANRSRNIEEWHKICESIGCGLGTSSDMDDMRQILSLSYYDLPSHLKTCLLYLSTFPEDYKIGKQRLIARWIAEDFVLHGEGVHSLFEIGESYFIELVNRSLIYPVDIGDDGMPFSCRVHDMVLDLICSLSREQNFVTISKGIEESKHSGSKVRRLSLQDTTWPTTSMSQVRSLTAFDGDHIRMMPPRSYFNLLRVLDLEGCSLRGNSHMKFLGNLFHLRYLGLACTGYNGRLPEDIGKLQFLQTLDLSETLVELPSSIVELKQLMVLYVDEDILLPNGIRNMTSRQILQIVTVTKDNAYILEELGHLTQLRTLTIDIDETMEESLLKALVKSLGKLCKIQTLAIGGLGNRGDDLMREGWVPPPCLRHFILGRLFVSGTFTTLPTWIHPTSLLLSTLEIGVHEVRQKDLQLLAMLPALLVLDLKVSKEIPVEGRFMLSTDAFPCLKSCWFTGFSILPSMFPPGAMPRLQCFTFMLCLRYFLSSGGDYDDLSICHLPSLIDVRVRLRGIPRVSNEVKEKVEEKLRHEAGVHPNHPIKFEIWKEEEDQHLIQIWEEEDEEEEEEEEEEDLCNIDVETKGVN